MHTPPLVSRGYALFFGVLGAALVWLAFHLDTRPWLSDPSAPVTLLMFAVPCLWVAVMTWKGPV